MEAAVAADVEGDDDVFLMDRCCCLDIANADVDELGIDLDGPTAVLGGATPFFFELLDSDGVLLESGAIIDAVGGIAIDDDDTPPPD